MPNEISKVEAGLQGINNNNASRPKWWEGWWSSTEAVIIIQKVIAELIGTYFLVFAGCGAVAINSIYGQLTFPGVAVVWGLIVMVMIYSLGHISGAHFNPAITITFAIVRRFPLRQVPLYIVGQLAGSLLASGTLSLMFDITRDAYFGTVPAGSHRQALALEILISFLLMFVVSGVATDSRAIGEMAGIAIGMTIMLNIFIAGPVSGGSMNPARSIGPAVVKKVYSGLWIYVIGPIIGAVSGGLTYNLIRFTEKPLCELANTKLANTKSLLRTISFNPVTLSS